jgi:hypothetical protein
MKIGKLRIELEKKRHPRQTKEQRIDEELELAKTELKLSRLVTHIQIARNNEILEDRVGVYR